MTLTGWGSIFIPPKSIFRTNHSALPSIIGISGPLTSISAFCTPQPESAAIRCSTVEIETPLSLDSFVHKTDPLTFR